VAYEKGKAQPGFVLGPSPTNLTPTLYQ